MITFYSMDHKGEEVKIKTSEIVLDEVYLVFERFLRACGYVIPYDLGPEENTIITDERGVTYGL